MDSTGYPSAWLFYILSQLILNMFLIELCVGVLSSTYSSLKEQVQGSALLNHRQQLWLVNVRSILSAKPKIEMQAPSWPAAARWFVGFRRAIFDFCENNVVQGAVYVAIALNAAAMAVHHFPSNAGYAAAELWMNVFFTAFFGVEMVLKLIGYGPRQYFGVASNCFDALLVAGSIVSAVMQTGTLGTMMRLFRVARLFRLVRTYGPVRRLLRTLAYALPIFGNILAIILLAIFGASRAAAARVHGSHALVCRACHRLSHAHLRVASALQSLRSSA